MALTISLSCVPFLRLLCLTSRPKDGHSRPNPSYYFSSGRQSLRQEEGLEDNPWTRQLQDIDEFAAIPRQCATRSFPHDSRPRNSLSTKRHRREVSDSTNSIIVQTSWEVTTEEKPSSNSAVSLTAEDEGALEKCPTFIYEGANLPFLGGEGDLETSRAAPQANDYDIDP